MGEFWKTLDAGVPFGLGAPGLQVILSPYVNPALHLAVLSNCCDEHTDSGQQLFTLTLVTADKIVFGTQQDEHYKMLSLWFLNWSLIEFKATVVGLFI